MFFFGIFIKRKKNTIRTLHVFADTNTPKPCIYINLLSFSTVYTMYYFQNRSIIVNFVRVTSCIDMSTIPSQCLHIDNILRNMIHRQLITIPFRCRILSYWYVLYYYGNIYDLQISSFTVAIDSLSTQTTAK